MADSLVSSQVYEIIKTIYSNPSTIAATDPTARISVLQNTLGQLRLANIATLDAITTHFTRLIELTSADETFVAALANNLAPCILRPRNDTPLTMHERHSYRLIRDLFAHKEAIFGELKRASALSHTPSGGKSTAKDTRLRGISTDESHRRENMEARNKAIANRSRNPSPAPQPNGHRRERSTGPATTRFPISTSPTNERKPGRSSLEVPGSAGLDTPSQQSSTANGTTNTTTIPEHEYIASQSEPSSTIDQQQQQQSQSQYSSSSEPPNGAPVIEKKDSLTRSSRFPMRKHGTAGSLSRGVAARAPGDRSSLASLEGGEGRQGVQLTDRPMDD